MPGSVSRSLVPYSCVFIDASWRHLFIAFLNSLRIRTSDGIDERAKLCQEIGSFFLNSLSNVQLPSNVLVCLSVRTGFDLFLRTKRFPIGSEVIMSAINIPSMIDIVREHGLVPVPWDLDAETVSPKVDLLRGLISDRSVAIVISHLFGKVCTTIDESVRIARQHQLYFLEDCAESFDVFGYLGHPQSDMVLFSFGTLKLFTAFGGAVCIIRDNDLHQRMKNLYDLDPVQSSSAYRKKLLSSFAGCLGLNVPLIMQLAVPVARYMDFDYKEQVVQMLRGFPAGEDLWKRLRQRPSLALLMMLKERLRTARNEDLRKSREKAYFVRRIMPEKVVIPGRIGKDGHDWLFPIIVDDPELVVNRLNAMGVDALTKATQLTVVDGDNHSNAPVEAQNLIDHIVYLPIHKNVPYEYLKRICKAVDLVAPAHRATNARSVKWKSKL